MHGRAQLSMAQPAHRSRSFRSLIQSNTDRLASGIQPSLRDQVRRRKGGEHPPGRLREDLRSPKRL
jgi:hypothetical protein